MTEAAHDGRRMHLHHYFENVSMLIKVPKVCPQNKIHPQLEKSRESRFRNDILALVRFHPEPKRHKRQRKKKQTRKIVHALSQRENQQKRALFLRRYPHSESRGFPLTIPGLTPGILTRLGVFILTYTYNSINPWYRKSTFDGNRGNGPYVPAYSNGS